MPYKEDIVQQFVDSFRKKGMGIGLYYSIWDSTLGIDQDKIGVKEIDVIKGQITELLSNYEKVDLFVTDGWYWRMGHRQVPYPEIRELIRRLQPDCLFLDHTHMQALYHVDIPYFEGPFGAYPPEDNMMPSAFGLCIASGNGWFWGPETRSFKVDRTTTHNILHTLNDLNSRYCTLMLNCMPNRDGVLDDMFLQQLREIGETWKPDETRPPLSPQGSQLRYSVPAMSAVSSSGTAANAIDSRQYGTEFTYWESKKGFPQSILLDLGATYSGLELLVCVASCRSNPRPEMSLRNGNITSYKVFLSTDNVYFTCVAAGEWAADAKMKQAQFPPHTARYIKLNVLDAFGERVIVTEIEAGAHSVQPQKVKSPDKYVDE